MRWVYLNHSCVREHEAFIPISDRGFLFGDGVFTTIKVSNGRAELLLEHLLQLQQDARQLSIECPLITNSQVEELIRCNEAFRGTWRLKVIITGGKEKSLGVPVRLGSLYMTLEPYDSPLQETLRVGVYPYSISGSISRLKTLSYLERLNVRQFALNNGYDDAVTLDAQGHLLETSFGNIFWKYEEEYYTPSPDLPLYYGVSIQQLEKRLQLEGIKLHFIEQKLENLSQEAEFFSISSLSSARLSFCPLSVKLKI